MSSIWQQAWAAMVATPELGTPVSFVPQGFDGQTHTFNAMRLPTPIEESSALSRNMIWLFACNFDIVPAPKKGDAIIFEGRGYYIEDVDLDTTGGAVLKCKKMYGGTVA